MELVISLLIKLTATPSHPFATLSGSQQKKDGPYDFKAPCLGTLVVVVTGVPTRIASLINVKINT